MLSLIVNTMHQKIVKGAKLLIAHLRQLSYVSDPRSVLLEDVPYFSQWESPELVAQFLDKKMSSRDDPKWQSSGAENKEEYEKWSWNGCGMACLKMILAHRKKQVVPLVTLAKQCLSYGGYQEPLDISPGLFYKPFCTFVEKEYQLKAVPVPVLTISDICHALAQGKYVIASVNYAIRNPESIPDKKGGHLVLIVGYDKERDVLFIHNPSGTSKESQAYAHISFKNFKRFFAQKGVLVNI